MLLLCRVCRCVCWRGCRRGVVSLCDCTGFRPRIGVRRLQAIYGWWLDGGLPHPSPPLWIPAFAGMTKWWGAGALGRPGWPPWLDEGLPHPSPPLWIPAFAGMTSCGGAVRGGRVVGWGASPLTAPLDSGLRRNDEVGGGLGMTGVGAGRGCSGSGLDRRTPYLFRGKVFD